MKRKLGEDKGLDFYILSHDEVDELLDFVEEVYQDMEDKSLYFKTEKDELIEYLDNGCVIVGVYSENRLIAFRQTVIEKFEDSLLKDLLTDIEDDHKVVCNDSCMVHKDYRGRGLQNKTRKITEKDLLEKGFKHFYSTVSNKNYHSFKNVFSDGFYLLDFKPVYYDPESDSELERFIFYKDVDHELRFTEKEYKIDVSDADAIKDALKDSLVAIDCDEDFLIFKEIDSMA